MKAFNLKSTVIAMTFLTAAVFFNSTVSSTQAVKRVDLFDAQGNNLMFVNFETDAGGNVTAYSVYFSDSTFTRKVFVKRDAKGVSEAHLNFAQDTMFNSTFTSSGAKTDISVIDYFGVDQLHAPVSYTKASDMDYNVLQNGVQTNKISYVYGNDGKPKRVNVYDKDNNLAYYGLFDSVNVGVLSPQGKNFAPRPSLSLKGDNAIAWQFTLDHAARVTCEAMSISGRRVATLFSGDVSQGFHSKILRMGAIHPLTNGAYIAVMSIDGKPVAQTKFIISRIRGGAR